MKNGAQQAPAVWVIAALAMLPFAGCGGGDQGDLGQVRGTVTMDGQPLPNVQVVFSPEKGRPSMGITDTNGQYQLTYIRATKGAVPGTHTVRLTTLQESTSDSDSGRPVKEKIPAKYNAATTLSRVVELGENTFDFALEPK